MPLKFYVILITFWSIIGLASAEYSDEYLSKSMQLQLMEDAYDEGNNKGFESGKKLTVDQVSELSRSVNSVNGTVSSLNKRITNLQDVELDTIRTSTVASKILDESAQLRTQSDFHRMSLMQQSEKLRAESASHRSEMLNTRTKLSEYDHSLKSAVNDASKLRKDVTTVLSNANEMYEIKLADATEQAGKIIDAANEKAFDIYTDHRRVMDTHVSCNLKNQRLIDILYCLTPPGWTIDPRVDNENILQSKTTYTSTKPRREAFVDLFTSIKKQTNGEIVLKVNFYPNLFNKDGEITPIIVVSEDR